jgi:hypothetical protein
MPGIPDRIISFADFHKQLHFLVAAVSSFVKLFLAFSKYFVVFFFNRINKA